MNNMGLLNAQSFHLSLALVRILKLQLQAVTQSEDVVATWLEEKNEPTDPVIYHLTGQKHDLYVCFCKEKPTYLCTQSGQKHGFLPCSSLYLEGGLVCFRICETFQHKGRLLPSPQYFSAGCPPSKIPWIYVDLWDLWPHRWTGYWSALSAPAWVACDSLWCNDSKPSLVLVLSSKKFNKLTLFFFFVFFDAQNCCSCPKLQSDCSHVCLGCGGKSSELLPVSGHWSKQRGRVSGPIRLPHWPRHKQLPEPLLGDQHTDLEKSSTSFFSRITMTDLQKKKTLRV